MTTAKQRYEVRVRCNALRRSLDLFERTFLDDSPAGVKGQAERHEVVNQALEGILGDGNHLRKALEFVEPDAIDQDLALRIKHLRNIYEHWEQHRDAFLETDVAPGRSGRWFADEYPDRSPHMYAWSKVGGFEIGGIINLRELHGLIDAAEAAVSRLHDTPPPTNR